MCGVLCVCVGTAERPIEDYDLDEEGDGEGEGDEDQEDEGGDVQDDDDGTHALTHTYAHNPTVAGEDGMGTVGGCVCVTLTD